MEWAPFWGSLNLLYYFLLLLLIFSLLKEERRSPWRIVFFKLYLKSTIGIEVEHLLHFSRRKVPRVYPSNINTSLSKKISIQFRQKKEIHFTIFYVLAKVLTILPLRFKPSSIKRLPRRTRVTPTATFRSSFHCIASFNLKFPMMSIFTSWWQILRLQLVIAFYNFGNSI